MWTSCPECGAPAVRDTTGRLIDIEPAPADRVYRTPHECED